MEAIISSENYPYDKNPSCVDGNPPSARTYQTPCRIVANEFLGVFDLSMRGDSFHVSDK
jgi:hypothetical protein